MARRASSLGLGFRPSQGTSQGGKQYSSADPRASTGPGVASSVPGRGKSAKRYRKILKDAIQGINKPTIRRLARRGGVKRISASIYDDVRLVVKAWLADLLQELEIICSYRSRKTIMASDVVFVLRRRGRTIYGFEPVK